MVVQVNGEGGLAEALNVTTYKAVNKDVKELVLSGDRNSVALCRAIARMKEGNLFLAGGYTEFDDWAKAEVKLSRTQLRLYERVSAKFDIDEIELHGPAKLDAALTYKNAKLQLQGRRVDLEHEQLTIIYAGDVAVTKPLLECTVREIEDATRELHAKSAERTQPTSKEADAIFQRLQKFIEEKKLPLKLKKNYSKKAKKDVVSISGIDLLKAYNLLNALGNAAAP